MNVSGVATSPHTSNHTPIVELCSQHMPAFGGISVPVCSAPTTAQRASKSASTNGNKRRRRKADQKSNLPGPRSTVFELACSVDSQMGQTNEELEISHVRLCQEHINLCDDNACACSIIRSGLLLKAHHHTCGEPYLVLRAHPGSTSKVLEVVRGSRYSSAR